MPETAEADEDESPKPDIDDDATVDVDLDAVDEDLQSEDRADDSDGSDGGETAIGGGGQTMGDMYVEGLCATSNAVIERYDGEPIDDSIPRDLGLDDAMNEFIRSQGMGEDLPPGQALLAGTTMFAVAVIASNPEIIEAVLDGVDPVDDEGESNAG
jgi:hypothetical protein